MSEQPHLPADGNLLPPVVPRTVLEHLAAMHGGLPDAPGSLFDRTLAHSRAHSEHTFDHEHAIVDYGPTPRPDQHNCCGGIGSHARFCAKDIR